MIEGQTKKDERTTGSTGPIIHVPPTYRDSTIAKKAVPATTKKWWITLAEETASWWSALQEGTICSTFQKWAIWTISQWSALRVKATSQWGESQEWWATHDVKKTVCGMSKNAAFTTLKVSVFTFFILISSYNVYQFPKMKATAACWIVSMCYEVSFIHHKKIIAAAVKLPRFVVCGILRCIIGRAARNLCMRCLSLCDNDSSISAAASILSSCVALFCGFLHIWCEWNQHHFATITLLIASAYALYTSLEALNPIMRTNCHSASLPSSASGSVLENGSDLENDGGRRGTTIGLPRSNSLLEQQPAEESQLDQGVPSPKDVMSFACIQLWFQQKEGGKEEEGSERASQSVKS